VIESIERVFRIDSPGLECYTTLKRPLEHYEKGLFVIEGDKVMERFFKSSLPLVSVLFTEKWFETFREDIEKRDESVKVFIACIEDMAHIVGFNYHHGIMAVGKIPGALTLDEAVADAKAPRLMVAIDRLDNSENVGVLVRNCAACGADALIVGETSADPYLRRAVRNSMGTVFRLPVVKSTSLRESLTILKTKFGFQIIAAHPHIDSLSLYNTDLTKDTCIVLGNEGDGISQNIIDICDYKVSIPMAPGIDSFNVACASAIILYEVNRQRA
jgi:tRNA G18 (ribose-2'-O)-methylase SpoU